MQRLTGGSPRGGGSHEGRDIGNPISMSLPRAIPLTIGLWVRRLSMAYYVKSTKLRKIKMKQYGILFNSELCVGCQTCEVACKHEHGSPVGVNRIRIFKKGPYKKNGKLKLDFHPVRCMHCADAKCMEACPVGAISRTPLKIVTIDDETCTGCKLCI